MDRIKKLIVKKLFQNDANDFIYDAKNVQLGDTTKITAFFTSVSNDILQEFEIKIEVDQLKKTWYKMRQKFVDINLKKIRSQICSPAEEEFYEYLIFLEKHISHKNEGVYETRNRQLIIYKIYDLLMGNTYAEVDDDVNLIVSSANSLDDFPIIDVNRSDNRENMENVVHDKLNVCGLEEIIDLSDTEELQVLEGFEDIVKESLINKKSPPVVPEQPASTQSSQVLNNEPSNYQSEMVVSQAPREQPTYFSAKIQSSVLESLQMKTFPNLQHFQSQPTQNSDSQVQFFDIAPQTYHSKMPAFEIPAEQQVVEESNKKNGQKIKLQNQNKNARMKKYPNVLSAKNQHYIKPLPSSTGIEGKQERYFASVRTKNEKIMITTKNEIIREALQIYVAALEESINDSTKQHRLRIIISAIEHFIQQISNP